MSERSPDALSGALTLGLLGSLPAALPAVVRTLPAAGALGVVSLLAAASLVVVPLSLWLRRAVSVGLPRADQALVAGAALSALPLALCGGVLKSTTHHRPLGGATFAVATLGLLALCVGLSFRVLRPNTSSTGGFAVKSTWQNLFILGCGSSLVSVVALGLSRAARPSLVDFLALLGAAAAAGLVKIPRKLNGSKLSLVLAGWVFLLAGALLTLKNPQLVRSLTTQAPVCFAPLSWLGGGS